MQLTEGIYSYIWHGIWENNSNMYYFANPLNLLIDPGMEYLFDTQTENLSEDGIKLTDVKYVLNTHCHPDHAEASAKFAERSDVTIGMHADEIEFYKQTGEETAKVINRKLKDIGIYKPFTEGALKINGEELQILNTPGHTPGSMSIYWPAKKALACGDLLFDHSFNRRNLPGVDYQKLCASIEKVLTLDVEYLMPGHAGIIITKPNVEARLNQALEDFGMFT